MERHYGKSRSLTDAQVEQVIARHAKRAEFRAIHGTVHNLANRLGVGVGPVLYCISQRARYLKQPEIVAMMSGLPCSPVPVRPRGRGNPGKLTDTQRAIVLKWHAAYIQAGCARGSIKRFALELRISGATYRKCIQRNGIYKQPYRERKPTTIKLQRKPVRPPSVRRLPRGYLETQMRITAMRAWKRATGVV